MSAYCKRLGLKRGWLVYADLGDSSPGVQRIVNADVEIAATSIQLGGEIEQLNASVKALAAHLVSYSQAGASQVVECGL